MAEADRRNQETDGGVMSRLLVAVAVFGALLVLVGGMHQFGSQEPPEAKITMYAE
jgi:hypothetical protein